MDKTMEQAKRKILLTGIGGDVACAIMRSLMDACPGDEFYGMDLKRETPYMERFRETATAPPCAEEGAWLTFVEELLVRHGITHFLPSTEPEILLADRHRERFRELGVRLMIVSSDILEICMSKYRTAHFFGERGIAVPETFRAEAYSGGLVFPFILKADFGHGGISLRKIENEEQWEACEKRGMVCQRLVGSADREYTVGVFSDGSRTRSIVYRRALGYGGMSVAVECVRVPELEKIAGEVSGALELRGSINLQLREEDGRYFLFEINPRLSSTTGFRHKMGFRDAVWWLELLDGRELEGEFHPPYGARGLKVTEDILLNC